MGTMCWLKQVARCLKQPLIWGQITKIDPMNPVTVLQGQQAQRNTWVMGTMCWSEQVARWLIRPTILHLYRLPHGPQPLSLCYKGSWRRGASEALVPG